jgi:hypothetical protein
MEPPRSSDRAGQLPPAGLRRRDRCLEKGGIACGRVRRLARGARRSTRLRRLVPPQRGRGLIGHPDPAPKCHQPPTHRHGEVLRRATAAGGPRSESHGGDLAATAPAGASGARAAGPVASSQMGEVTESLFGSGGSNHARSRSVPVRSAIRTPTSGHEFLRSSTASAREGYHRCVGTA